MGSQKSVLSVGSRSEQKTQITKQGLVTSVESVEESRVDAGKQGEYRNGALCRFEAGEGAA